VITCASSLNLPTTRRHFGADSYRLNGRNSGLAESGQARLIQEMGLHLWPMWSALLVLLSLGG